METTTKQSNVAVKIQDLTANAAPLGLLGFGITTVLLNLHNAGYYGLGSMILAMGIFYGGLAQVFAGLMEWKKGNTFATTAFLSYGLFWLSLVALVVMPKMGIADPTNSVAMGAYFIMWGIFTAVMFLGTLNHSRAMQVVFGALAILFFLLAAAELTGNAMITVIAGYEGIFTGLAAVYAGLAQVVNEAYHRTIVPLGMMS
jgi:succinate-acetate transporter protein